MSDPWRDAVRVMKNRLDMMDPELRKKIEGLTDTQIALMADIFQGIGQSLRESAHKDLGLIPKSDPNAQN